MAPSEAWRELGTANFLELRKGEVRRITLPRTSVYKPSRAMRQGSLCGMLRGVSSKGHKQREGRTGEESNVSGYGRTASDVDPGADGVGSRRHHVRQPVRARSAISYIRVLQPGARRYNFYKRSTVYRFGQPRAGSAKKWWSCHPSASGVAAAWVGHPDLRDPQAQVNLTNFVERRHETV